MKKTTLLLFVALFCVSSLSVSAQDGSGGKHSYGILSYSPALPVGKSSDFTSDFSFTGGTVEAGWYVKENIALGIRGSFNYLYEKRENELYTSDKNDLAINGTQYRSNYVVPVQFKGTYFFSGKDKMTPFAAVGAGATYQNRELQVGTFFFDKIGWEFSVAPEVGATFRDTPIGNLVASVRFDQGFGTDDLPSVQYLTFNIGLSSSL